MAMVSLDLFVRLPPRSSSASADMIVTRIWNGISMVGIAVTYFPHSQTRAKGEAAIQILKEIDYFGGFTSIVGLTLL